MHIAVNAANLGGYGSGLIGRALLSELPGAGGHQVTAWVPRAWARTSIEGVDLRAANSGGWKKPLFEHLRLPGQLRRAGASVLFNLCDAGVPSRGIPQLLMLQQAHIAYEPAAWGYAPDPRLGARFAVLSAYFRAGLRHVRHFTVQTEDMRSRLAERWKVDPDRITVIPSFVDDHVLKAAAAPAAAPVSPPYVCYVGSHAAHKNHRVLASAFALLRRTHPELRCVVTVERAAVPALVVAAERHGVLDRFQFVGSLERGRVIELLGGASVAVIPSVLESFGLPYYEAMALGVPVVAAERAFSREACADAARYAPPDSGEAFAGAIVSVLENRESWSRRATARFGQVHVLCAEVARRYVQLLEHLA